MSYNLKIGSHVSMSKGKKYLLGAVQEALSYNANALMIYTGAPQNTKRVSTSDMMISEAHQLMEENNIEKESIIIHAPYIVNLANGNAQKRRFAIEFLKEEYKRTAEFGSKIMVLHPGNHLKETNKKAMDWIIKGLNEIIQPELGVIIALETMAGKGTEIGINFEQLKYMIDGVEKQAYIGVCIDTCHVHDAGYDIKSDFDSVLDEFDNIIGLDKISVLHINDSKNELGSGKDRHENVGKGFIGEKTLIKIVNHPKLNGIVKILETPYINGHAPYKEEIKILRGK